MEHKEIEKQLQDLPNLIEKKTEEVIQTREEYLTAKATYEYRYNEIYLACKLKDENATQGDLTAQSKVGSHQERLNTIIAESKYKRAQKELQKIRDDLDTVRELSYNYRQELKRFGG